MYKRKVYKENPTLKSLRSLNISVVAVQSVYKRKLYKENPTLKSLRS